jgi:hypothetical protein
MTDLPIEPGSRLDQAVPPLGGGDPAGRLGISDQELATLIEACRILLKVHLATSPPARGLLDRLTADMMILLLDVDVTAGGDNRPAT